jgi:malonyl-CoA O-methyltransferase
VAARLLEFMPDAAVVGAGRVLEVGCGTGVLTDLLLRRYARATIHVTDMAEGMVARVRERWPALDRLTAEVADARSVAVAEPVDLVASSAALHWAIPLAATFGHLRRRLRPDGALVFSLMVDGTLGELHALRRRIAPGKPPAGRLATSDEVAAALAEAGLVIGGWAEEGVQSSYRSADDFLRTLHAQGLTGGGVSRAAQPLSRSELERLKAEYDLAFSGGHGNVYASFKVLYVSASGKDD